MYHFDLDKQKSLDFSSFHSTANELLKKAKKSNRWITCSLCGKTITKKSIVLHFFAFHEDSEK